MTHSRYLNTGALPPHTPPRLQASMSLLVHGNPVCKDTPSAGALQSANNIQTWPGMTATSETRYIPDAILAAVFCYTPFPPPGAQSPDFQHFTKI